MFSRRFEFEGLAKRAITQRYAMKLKGTLRKGKKDFVNLGDPPRSFAKQSSYDQIPTAGLGSKLGQTHRNE